MNARTLVSLFAAASVVAAPLSAFAGDDAATALLAKHKAFAGWQAGDGSLKSYRLTGKYDAFVRRGGLYRHTSGGGPTATANGFTGNAFWVSNDNGNAARLYDDQVREAVSLDALEDEQATLLDGTSRGDATVEGKAAKIVRVLPPQGDPMDLYIDPVSGAYLEAVIDDVPTDRQVTLIVDGYLDAGGGKKVMGSYHYEGERHVVFDSVDVTTPVADAELHPPVSRQHWDFVDGDSVPIDVVVHNQAYSAAGGAVEFHATFNGHTGNFVLDSGAAGIFIDESFANSIGMTDLGESSYSGVNGNTMHGRRGLVKTIEFGKSVLHDSVVAVSAGNMNAGVDGYIGYDFLANALVDVDLDGHKLTILDPTKYGPTVAHDAYAFPVDVSSGQPELNAMAGKYPFKPIVDTGNDFDVVVTDALRAPGKLIVMDTTKAEFRGVDGESDYVDCGRVNMAVGPFRYEDAPVCFGPVKNWGQNGGLLGFDFMRHFNWTFDYPEGKLVLTPNSAK